MHAADTSVLVRTTIRAVGVRHGLRTSFSPKVDAAGVGNGGHVHLSLWRDERNLMAGGTGRFGLTDEATAFAGRGPRAPAGAARDRRARRSRRTSGWCRSTGPAPTRAGAWRTARPRCGWSPARPGSEDWAANLEVKCFDLHANPYLMLAGLLATGTAGLDGGADAARPGRRRPGRARRGRRSPRAGSRGCRDTLREALDAFAADDVLASAFGDAAGRGDPRRPRVGAGAVRRRLARGGRGREPLGALTVGATVSAARAAERGTATVITAAATMPSSRQDQHDQHDGVHGHSLPLTAARSRCRSGFLRWRA